MSTRGKKSQNGHERNQVQNAPELATFDCGGTVGIFEDDVPLPLILVPSRGLVEDLEVLRAAVGAPHEDGDVPHHVEEGQHLSRIGLHLSGRQKWHRKSNLD